MMKMLKKTTSSMARTGGSVPAVVYAASADEDLSAWELVNASQSDDEDLYSFDGDFVSSESDGVIEAEPEIKLDHDEEEEESAGQPSDLVAQDDVVPSQDLLLPPPTIYRFQTTVSHLYGDHGKRFYGCDDSDNDEEDDDDDDDAAHDVDDELMPWKLKGKFGKQRMKKMGKKVGPKPSNSKKLPYYYHNRPSRVYGSNRKIEW